MNWNEIKEKYPKAFHKMHQWHYGELAYKTPYPPIVIKEYNRLQENYSNRFLYDFFDGQTIYVEVYPVSIQTDFTATLWTWDISNERVSPTDTKTRYEAEEQAFLKAFEILEDRS